MTKIAKTCPECGSKNQYQYKKLMESTGGYGPSLLPQLNSGIFSSAKHLTVVCEDCGYMRLYASEAARKQLSGSKHWGKV